MSDTLALDSGVREVVRAAVLDAATTPQTLAALKKAAKEAAKAKKDKKAAEAVVADMVAAGELYRHGTNKTAPYGKEPPADPNDPVKVRAALLQAAGAPLTLTNLVKAVVGSTKATKDFVTDQVNRLIEDKHLHKHPPASGRTPLFGREAPRPPHPLDVDPFKKALTALVKAFKTAREGAPGVTLDQLFHRIRAAVPDEGAAVNPPAPISPPAPPNDEPKSELTPERIRAAIKDAYNERVLHLEPGDKLVEVRLVYHEAARHHPDLTVARFHQELKHLQQQRTIELHALNEVQKAKEPELAVHHNDSLLYFVLWGKS